VRVRPHPKKTQFDHLRLPRVFGGEAIQRVIHNQNVEIKRLADVRQGIRFLASAPLGGIPAAGVVNQYVAHHAGGH